MLLHHALAPLPSTNSEARATATCVGKRWKSFFQPVRLQPDVARHARAPAPLGSRREVSHERPSQDKTPLWDKTGAPGKVSFFLFSNLNPVTDRH